jgi:hypothetical protein
MAPADGLVAGAWFAAVGLMLVLAWEPWRATRGLGPIDLSDEPVGRVVSPGYVFVLPLLVAAAPLVARFMPGEVPLAVWREPHVLLPGIAVVLAVIVAFEAYLCRRVLAAARRRAAALEEKREVFASAARRSSGRPR